MNSFGSKILRKRAFSQHSLTNLFSTSAEQLDRLKVSWTKLQDQKKETPNK
jgi:hypothetical protein